MRTSTSPVPTRARSPAIEGRGQLARTLLGLAGPEQLHHGAPDGRRQRVAAERGPVAARVEHAEHLLGGHHRRDRDDPTAERLAQHVDVGDDALEVAGEGRPVRPSPDWISSAMNSTSFAVHSSRTAAR